MKKQLTKHKKTCSLANRVGLKSPNLPALNASAPSHSKSSVRKPEEMERQGMKLEEAKVKMEDTRRAFGARIAQQVAREAQVHNFFKR